MNKTELVSALAAQTKLTQKDTALFLEAFITTVKETLKTGGDVTLVGFGTFKVGQRSARIGRNPKTGAALEIKASKVPQFKAGKALKEALA
jgi:DNA-binding protein HU-beta